MECKCGCGTEIKSFNNRNVLYSFISGHNLRNRVKKEKVKQVCSKCNRIYFRYPSHSNVGKNNYCSNECRYLDNKNWISGEKNPRWKGGFNGVQNIRWCPEYRIWRLKVFERDKYVCQECGNKSSRKNPLHAHHIIKFSESIELMFELDNGITMCKSCHLKIHRRVLNAI